MNLLRSGGRRRYFFFFFPAASTFFVDLSMLISSYKTTNMWFMADPQIEKRDEDGRPNQVFQVLARRIR